MSKKEAIKKAAFGEHKNLLKIRPGTKYNELYAQLKPVFEDPRKKGHWVDFNWLWSKARNIYRSQNGDDAVLGKHVIATFIRRNHLKYRRVQRNKNQSKEAYREKLQKWHYTLRERLVRTGSTSKDYDTKWDTTSQNNDSMLINHHYHLPLSVKKHMKFLRRILFSTSRGTTQVFSDISWSRKAYLEN